MFCDGRDVFEVVLGSESLSVSLEYTLLDLYGACNKTDQDLTPYLVCYKEDIYLKKEMYRLLMLTHKLDQKLGF